jgi:glycerophosphoryl diester phosphodiesterase
MPPDLPRFDLPRFDLMGHRGARGLFPENTLEGFAAAMAAGIAAFELDVAVTADGVPVVHHDPALHPDIARGPDGRWLDSRGPLIRDLSFAGLQRYDVGRLRPGSRTAALHPDQVPHDGCRVPALVEVLRLPARFLIELKLFPAHRDWTVPPAEMVARTLDAVAAAGAADRVAIESFDWHAMRRLGAVRPDMPRAWLTEPRTEADRAAWWGDVPDGSTPQAVAAQANGPGQGTWAPEHASLTEAAVREAHALGLRVVPWTVNQPDDMRRLIAWGVDGLISDRPDLCLPLLP